MSSRESSVASTGNAALGERLLQLLAEIPPDLSVTEATTFRKKLGEFQQQVGALRDSPALEKVVNACLVTCEQYFKASRAYTKDREKELRDLIVILRDAAKLLVGDSKTFSATLLSSSERFGAIAQLDDIRDLKRQLSNEVTALRGVVAEKQARDERAYAELSERVDDLQTRLMQAEEEATIDALTRVANRGGFNRALIKMMGAARRTNLPLSLALIDLDNFKQINDQHGHPMGDRVLLCTAMWLREGARPADFVARCGGDEFALILSASVEEAETRLTQIVARIAGSTYEGDVPTMEGGAAVGTMSFTVSCGIAGLTPSDSEADLLRRADEALYKAKHKGKNQVATKKPSMLDRLVRLK